MTAEQNTPPPARGGDGQMELLECSDTCRLCGATATALGTWKYCPECWARNNGLPYYGDGGGITVVRWPAMRGPRP